MKAAGARMLRQAPRRLRIKDDAVVLYQHKPYGFLSPSTAPEGNKVFAIDLLKQVNFSGDAWTRDVDPRDLPGLRAAGRLDADSTGLMVWSNDRSLVEYIIGQSSQVEKEYMVRVSGHELWSAEQMDETISQLREGMQLDNEPLKPVGVQRVNPEQLRMTLTEGKHRQIRRMCALVGLQVDAIKRVRIGQLRLKGLQVGNWVALKPRQAGPLFQSQFWKEQQRADKRYERERFVPGARS